MPRISDYPQLKALCWNRDREGSVTEEEAMRIYERNWRHVRVGDIGEAELAFMKSLQRRHNAVFEGLPV